MMRTHEDPLQRLTRSLSLLLVGCSTFGSLVISCKDPAPVSPNTKVLSLGAQGATARESFESELESWQPVEGSWSTRAGNGGQVLVQSATDRAFPVALWKAQRYEDVDVSVRFQPLSGQIDASGGIVFRARDPQNYYVVRANSLEDNFRLYTVIDGTRRQIAGVQIEPPALGEWHELRVVAVGPHIQAHLDGRLLLDHHDDTFDAGWVGLWTKADAVTEFDDLVIRGAPEANSADPNSGKAPAAAATASPAPGDPTATAADTAGTLAKHSFEGLPPGKLPAPWASAVGEWRVERAEDALQGRQVVTQQAANASPVFNVALLSEPKLADVDLSVLLRARKGRIDQGGGLVWRALDEKNYYIARYNPLEDNFRVYTVKDGRRRQIGSADVQLPPTAWHTLRVTMRGDHIRGYLNGKKHLDVHDSTFSEPGQVGLWTKADAQTEFDELLISPATGSED